MTDSSDPTAVVEARERSSGREAPNVGDYVLATKYCDGDPGDAWALGFYTGTVSDRHMVRDNSGKNIRPSGYRRIGRITEEFGHWLWNNRDVLESSSPGTVNLWGMLGGFAIPREDFTPPRFEARTTEAQHRQDGQEQTTGQQGEEGKT